MKSKLVIVESPAKAKTISRFLGDEYHVEASVGHIRDLPDNRKGLPEDLRKKWWADYAVDVDAGFEPIYEVTNPRAVDSLKRAMKGVEELYLATDEDREGESISWHLLETLKPKKTVKVQRVAFHEITREAIQDAFSRPRDINTDLVEAQTARRVLDRLFGYTLSPVLWRRVKKNLSAGRVQSPAVKLIVDREKQRAAFKVSEYWDLEALLSSEGTSFKAKLVRIGDQNLADGDSFEPTTGQLKNAKELKLDEKSAKALAGSAADAKPWTVVGVEKKEVQQKPSDPYRTASLQQDANNRLGFEARRTMRVAQNLYEGVEIGSERTGLITYMRTDSIALSDEAIKQARSYIGDTYGDKYLPSKPNVYRSKVANAQEAHEAIRPTDISRHPDSLRQYLSKEELDLYRMIWQRTVASQMVPARVERTAAEIEVEVDGKSLRFRASGKRVLFDGFLKAMDKSTEDEDDGSKEPTLPALAESQVLEATDVQAVGHKTRPPARYTDATLIKRLEELGIGRPSTYATILDVINQRDYVRKQRKELVPTWTAFIVMQLLEDHFNEFMELDFTAKMDEDLDEIANGKQHMQEYLAEFFLGGNGQVGLKPAVDERSAIIPYPLYPVGTDDTVGAIHVKMGRSGCYIEAGTAENRLTASLPDDLAPADLTIEKAVELLQQKREGPKIVGETEEGRPIELLKGRFGPYLRQSLTEEEIASGMSYSNVSLPAGVNPEDVDEETARLLIALPRDLGRHPETKEPVLADIGRYGPFVKCGAVNRSLTEWRQACTISLDEALELLSQAPVKGGAKAQEYHNFGKLEGAEGDVRVLSGRYGPYVTDGKTNATLPKDVEPEKVSQEQALQLLADKRAKGPSKRPFKRTGRRGR
ncbi:MAG: type I DNA topoisomerase [Fimbriimonadaceae bacterium]